MPDNIPPLTFGNFYHIYNRGNNRENVFIQERNYEYFMILWWKHTFQIAETYAYCLLKNHFHALVRIKDMEELTGLKIKEPSQYFSNLFNAYTRAVNLTVGRSGALFERPFERIPVTKQDYLLRLVVYIHQNPQKHKFVGNFRDWQHSSYHDLIAETPTRLQREKLMGFFGGKPDFLRIHQELQPLESFDESI